MAVLGFDSTLVFFNFCRRLFEHFHVDDVVSAVHAGCPVSADKHSDVLRDSPFSTLFRTSVLRKSWK